VKEIYWTLGAYDVIVTLEAPKDEDVTALMFKVGALGNLKSHALRAFTEPEVDNLLRRVS
jgi:uncharacterized protein with GYD domain